jgi:hypothetical protein
MSVGRLERIATAMLLVSSVLLPPAAAQNVPARRVEIDKLTCTDLTTLKPRESHDRLLVYMNGYLDGTQKATTWDAELVAKRIDEVVRFCKANPASTLLDAFKRAWTR